MTWNEEHSRSEKLAAQAGQALVAGDRVRAESLYREAAEAEAGALALVAGSKRRTRGITAVSAVSLHYKGHEYEAAEALAHSELAHADLSRFARAQLRDILYMIWAAMDAEQAGVKFVAGDIVVSVKGGDVVRGGAPLDLILKKVEGIQAVLYRTAEMVLERPFRKRGGPALDLQTMVRPWLLQAPAGSYQFAVRIQEPAQLDLFEDRPDVERITRTVFEVLCATAADPEMQLPEIVQDADYRRAFLGLARNLAPTGKVFERLEVRDAGSPSQPVASFVVESRRRLNWTIGKTRPEVGHESVVIDGVLRALHLDQDWLEVTVSEEADKHVRVENTGDALDDVVGPMVNRQVHVTAIRRGAKYLFQDIELDE